MVARDERGRLEVRVLDYGIALPLGARALDSDTVSGTPLYMPPEQWRGGTVEAATDVYALGCVVLEMLSGSPPFEGSLVQLANAHYFRVPERAAAQRPELPSVVDELVAAMLAKESGDRPTMAGVAQTLWAAAVRRARDAAVELLNQRDARSPLRSGRERR